MTDNQKIIEEYENRRAQLNADIAELDRAHEEWLSLEDGQKWLRIKAANSLNKEGHEVSVYSEIVKTHVIELVKKWDDEAEESRQRLREMGVMK